METLGEEDETIKGCLCEKREERLIILLSVSSHGAIKER